MGKLNKNYADFFGKATAAGYGTNEIVNFMEGLFQNPVAKAEKNRLQQGTADQTLRPDEQAGAQALHQSEFPERLVKGAASIATRLGGAGLAATKLPGLIQKGIGAIGALGGMNPKEKAPQEEESEQPKGEQPGSFQEFMKQNPELGAFLQREMSAGISPQDAAMKAKAVKKFRESIASIEDQIGQPFEALLAQLFQERQQEQAPQQKQQSPKMSEFMQALKEFQQMMGK